MSLRHRSGRGALPLDTVTGRHVKPGAFGVEASEHLDGKFFSARQISGHTRDRGNCARNSDSKSTPATGAASSAVIRTASSRATLVRTPLDAAL
jgi:hypothetical protein